jgi:hypothetical protein
MNMGHDQHSPHKMICISNSTLNCSSFDLHQGPLSKQPILHPAINMMRGGNFRSSAVLQKRCHWLRQRACRLGRGHRLQPRINSRAGDVQFVFDNARSASQSGSRSSDPSHSQFAAAKRLPIPFSAGSAGSRRASGAPRRSTKFVALQAGYD